MKVDELGKNFDAQLLAEEPQPTLSMHPKKFMLWLFIVTVVMIFAALTSAYLVRQAEGNWVEFELPSLFWVNSAVLLLSSITMHWAYISARKDNLGALKIAITLTFLLGVAFLAGQWISWGYLVDINVFFVGNPSGSFLYVLTGIHAVHLISGLIVLLFALVAAYRFTVHSKSLTQIEMCATYWHFLDVLWLYLFVFLLVNHS